MCHADCGLESHCKNFHLRYLRKSLHQEGQCNVRNNHPGHVGHHRTGRRRHLRPWQQAGAPVRVRHAPHLGSQPVGRKLDRGAGGELLHHDLQPGPWRGPCAQVVHRRGDRQRHQRGSRLQGAVGQHRVLRRAQSDRRVPR